MTDRKGRSIRRVFAYGGGVYLVMVVLGTVAVTFGVAMLLVTIFENKQDARQPYVRLVEVDEVSTDPEPWGINWPFQYDSYRRTVDHDDADMDTSNMLTASKLKEHPWLGRLYAGYAFSIDYRELRGHAYMLYDQEVTERVTDLLDAIREAKASGATEEELEPILDLQNKATWRLDFISSENSKGFHADQEAARILGESIDYSRRAQAAALRLRPPQVRESEVPVEPVQGVSDLSAEP